MITFKNEYGIKYSVISFDELLKFIDYDFISEINCSNNNLTQLPILPLYLVKLDCSNNKLSSLPEIPKNLGWLYTADNNLSNLPVMPLSLRILECSNNKLYKLPELPRKVKYLYCINNNITDLPDMPENLHYILYDNNPIYDFIDEYFEGCKTLYFEWKTQFKKKYVSKLSNWFLECKYNPKYKYCRDRVNANYDELV